MIITREVIQHLNQILNLTVTGDEQDWAIEVSDPDRVKEFIKVYKSEKFTKGEKIAFVSLILASYEELLYKQNESEDIWNDIRQILLENRNLFEDIIVHWALKNEIENKNWYKITPLIRGLDSNR